MESITIKLVMEKATKNTVRYSEVPPDGEEPVIRTMYVAKASIGNPVPQELHVTIEG